MAEPISTAAALGISAGVSALGSAGSAIATGNLNRKNRKFQRQENEKSRAFNAEQAELAYQRQREFYDYQQQMYTSPSAQMRLLKEADLNPDLVYGHGAFQSVVPPSVSAATSSAGSSPQTFDVGSGIQRGTSELAQIGLGEAQRVANVKNTNANTNKVEAETDESISRTKNNAVMFELLGQKVNWTSSQDKLTNQELANAKIQGENMVKQRDVMDANIRNLDANTEFVKASATEKNRIVQEMIDTYEKRFDMLDFQVKDLMNQCSIGESQAKLFYETLGSTIIKMKAESRSATYETISQYWDSTYKAKLMSGLNKDGRRNMQIMIDMAIGMLTNNAGMLEKQYDLLKTYGDAHEIVNMTTQTLNSVANVVGSVKGMPGIPFNVNNNNGYDNGFRPPFNPRSTGSSRSVNPVTGR